MVFKHSFKDLDVAEKALKKMASTESFSEFDEEWQILLYRLQRAWERCERKIKKEKGFQQWFEPYKKLKETDPLLVFLKQARNAETHAISNTIDKPIHLLIQDKNGRPFQLDKVNYAFKDGTLEIDIKTPDLLLSPEVEEIPTNPKLIKCRNGGVDYDPPKKHLGNSIEGQSPVVAAKLGLEFYRSFVSEAETKFSECK